MHIRNWTEEQSEYLNTNYTVKPKKEIELFLGKKWHSIQEFARRRGLFRPQDKFNKRNGTLRPLLEDTNEAFYWMGFLMADGYCYEPLSQIVLSIKDTDEEHIKKFANFLKTKYHKYKNSSGYNADYVEVRVSVAEKNICQDILKRWDWKPNKTYNPPDGYILKELFNTEEKFLSFLIGFIDGDGYVSLQSTIIKIENHIAWKNIHQVFVDSLRYYDYSVNHKILISARGYSAVLINSQGLKKIQDKITQLKIPYLERKWNNEQTKS